MLYLEIREYQTAEGKTPLTAWLGGLRNGATRGRIVARLDRLKAGLFGDWKTVGSGVCELRNDLGPGYRVYYGQEGKTLILLLCGGDKSTQAKDIETAHAYWKDHKARLPKPPVQSSGSPPNRGRHRRIH
jgi:putative addiction module killer protein